MPKRRRYKGQVGVFRAPSSKSGWRRIDRRGRVSNVTLPAGMTEPTNVIKNPFRSGKWSWQQARQRPRPQGGAGSTAGASGVPTSGGADTGFTPDFTSYLAGIGGMSGYPQVDYNGPWVQGYDLAANPHWKPLTSGGYINVNTGQTYTDPAVAAAQASEYEKTLMEALKGMFGGSV